MTWTVLFHDAFDAEFMVLADEFEPNLGRPTVDTFKGSRYANMKEIRFSWNGQV